MQKTVLLSIKPKFAEKILNGKKIYEYRRVLFKSSTVRKVIIYASSPVRKVIGEFEIEATLTMSKQELWRDTCDASGITWEVFTNYFNGRTVCHAIKVKNPMRYKHPKTLKAAVGLDKPPQSFTYVAA